MKIVIFGGSGFVGEGLIKRLSSENQIFVISRQAQNKFTDLKNVQWIHSDLMKDETWQKCTAEADWVIDCIGILLPKRNRTYQNSSLKPARKIIQFLGSLSIDTRAKFLFISAKKMPFFFDKGYMCAKLQIENEMRRVLPESSLSIFPSLIYDSSHKRKRFSANLLKMLNLKNYQPQSREFVAAEVEKVLAGENSILTRRDY